MPQKLMYITNDIEIAKIAEESGVDWIFIDLEIRGKEKRQGHLDTVISRHRIDDIGKVKNALTKAKLLVRVNPIYEGSKEEIDQVIGNGADIIMLPYFTTSKEVKTFIDYVDGRAKVCLLLETPEAVATIDEILSLSGIDYIHIGLNDLHLGYGMRFMFELLADGTVEMLCKKIKEKSISYGFGGVAQVGQGALPAENILAEHYRLGSSMVILSRTFCDTKATKDRNHVQEVFTSGVKGIRAYEELLTCQDESFFTESHRELKRIVHVIVEKSAERQSI